LPVHEQLSTLKSSLLSPRFGLLCPLQGLPLALKDASFLIKPGTKVGICGRTGAIDRPTALTITLGACLL